MSALMSVFLRLSGVEFYFLVNRTSNRVEKTKQKKLLCKNILYSIPVDKARHVSSLQFHFKPSRKVYFENLTKRERELS